MPITRRASTAIALALTSLSTTGCPLYTCGDLSFSEREMSGSFPLEEDGSVLLGDGSAADPVTDEGCEALCEDLEAVIISTYHSCEAVLSEDNLDTGTGAGSVIVSCVVSGEDYCMGGRHSGTLVQRAHGHGVDEVAAWLAREACGEAGSVHAFRQLARELRHHGAPAELVAAATAAAGDEIQHTRLVRHLARQHGGAPAPVHAQRLPPRDLLTIALENAVEGCVHETFAAARAGWQARSAADPDVRAVSAVLAQDEARHADLAAAVHAWACAVLPPSQAAIVESARRAAWQRLAESPTRVGADTALTLGLPGALAHRRLAGALAAALEDSRAT